MIINLGWSVCMSISTILTETPWGIPPLYQGHSFVGIPQFQRARGWIWSLYPPCLQNSMIPRLVDSTQRFITLSRGQRTLPSVSPWQIWRITDMRTVKGRERERCCYLGSASPDAGSTSACKSSPTFQGNNGTRIITLEDLCIRITLRL